jgi:CheY-like chemotaxis protein
MKASAEVLFVEYSAGDALLMSQALTELPIRVKLHIARDGRQALMMLSDPSFEPALVILDLSLPLVSGHDVLQRNPRKDIPVVVFSASWNDVDLDRAFSLGAAEYVQKPMDLTAYKDAVRAMIEKWVVHKKDDTGR